MACMLKEQSFFSSSQLLRDTCTRKSKVKVRDWAKEEEEEEEEEKEIVIDLTPSSPSLSDVVRSLKDEEESLCRPSNENTGKKRKSFLFMNSHV